MGEQNFQVISSNLSLTSSHRKKYKYNIHISRERDFNKSDSIVKEATL